MAQWQLSHESHVNGIMRGRTGLKLETGVNTEVERITVLVPKGTEVKVMSNGSLFVAKVTRRGDGAHAKCNLICSPSGKINLQEI